MEKLIQKITDPELRSQMERVASFHGYLSTGAFIGVQMLNIAHRVLGLNDKERIIVTCETQNCLPDPFQILAGSTIGNKGLKIKDYGKMAVTINRRGPAGSRVKSVRIMLDPAKTAQYPRLHAWFMKTAKVPHQEAVSILLDAGGYVLRCIWHHSALVRTEGDIENAGYPVTNYEKRQDIRHLTTYTR